MYIILYSIPSEVFNLYYERNKNSILSYFGPLNYININVGANNSGKSRFLREILKQKIIVTNPNNTAIDLILDSLEKLIQFKDSNSKNYSFKRSILPEIDNYVSHLQQYLKNIHNSSLESAEFFRRLENTLNTTLTLKNELSPSNYTDFKNILDNLKEAKELLQLEINNNLERIYIPVLRTANKLLGTNNIDFLADFIYNTYNISKDNIEIFTGLNIYDTILNDKNNEEEYRIRVYEFEKFISSTFFNSQNVIITPLYKTNTQNQQKIYIKIGDEKERELYNMGDGINSIIILMYKIFTCNKNCWIFIEEPEIFLHPGFQRIFLDTILNNQFILDKQLLFFLNTHSNHILDLSISNSSKISIFSFERFKTSEAEGFYINNALNNDLDLLNQLGVNNSSVFMANCSVWVEGITDRLYFQKYLKLFYESSEFNEIGGQIFQEDIHYTFFEYAGSNVTHYIFTNKDEIEDLSEFPKIKAQFLCNRILLIADRDNGKEIKHSILGEQVSDNFQYLVTKSKEIENLISAKTLKLILPSLLNDIKEENLEKYDIKESNYKKIGLGKYFIKLFNNKLKNKISAKSGTLKTYYKNKMAKLIFENEAITWDNLSDEAKEITKNIYFFIKAQNERN